MAYAAELGARDFRGLCDPHRSARRGRTNGARLRSDLPAYPVGATAFAASTLGVDKPGSVTMTAALDCGVVVAPLMAPAVSEKTAGEHTIKPFNKTHRYCVLLNGLVNFGFIRPSLIFT